VEVTVAFRGISVRSAISQKKSPSESATFRPFFVTSA
jgi:hypothetical protein